MLAGGIDMEVGGRGKALRLGIVAALVAVFLVGFAVVPPRVSGATIVCGTLAGSVVWTPAGNPYYVTCYASLAQGATLTIQAGVTAFFAPATGLGVQGALIVQGTPNAPVVFDSNASAPAPGDWFSVSLGSYAYAQIVGLVVRHAETGLIASGTSPTGGSLYVLDSEFADNSQVGISAGGSIGTQGSVLRGIHVHDNGMGIATNASLYIADSTIEGNAGDGIRAGVGPLYLTNSTVFRNRDRGISLWAIAQSPPYARSSITCNRVAENGVGVDIEAMDPTAGTANVATASRNNVVNNTLQARDTSASSWDDGTAGNYWNNYTGTDGNGDGFGDTPFIIDADSQDHFPFMAPVAGCPGGPPQPIDHAPAAATALDAQLAGNQLRDVALSWDLSADDGAGENDVTAYLLSTSPTFDRAGAGYSLLATLPPGTTTYTDAGAGARDPVNHFYRLVVRDAAGHTAASADQFVKYARSLAAGPQLLSIPVHMSDTGIDAVLRGVDYRYARTYVNPAGQGKNWLTKARDKPWGDLTNVDERMALWLWVERDSSLVVAGLVKTPVAIPLAVGWNFVGYPSFVDRTVGDALAGAKLQTVEGFDPAGSPYYLRRLAPTDVLRAGDGLWVHVSEAFDWAVAS